MKNIILTLFVLLPISALGQYSKEFTNVSEYRFSNSLLDAVESKSYNSGIRMLDSILIYTNSPDRYVVISGIECCLETYKKDRLVRLLDIAQEQHYSLSSMKEDIEPVYSDLIETYNNLFLPKQDTVLLYSIAHQLAQMLVDDQVCRGVMFEPFVKRSEKLGYPVIVDHEKSAAEVDSVNTILLDTILMNYPNLNKEDVGAFGMSAVFAIIQHSGPKNMNKYKSHMDLWFDNGDIQRSSYALYIDRYLMYQDKPQIYASQLKNTDGKLTFYSIGNIYEVEAQRMKMGLESIKKYASRFGIDWSQYYREATQRP